jgi:hypothetical protein
LLLLQVEGLVFFANAELVAEKIRPERRGLHVCRFVKIAADALRGSIGSAEFNLSLACS